MIPRRTRFGRTRIYTGAEARTPCETLRLSSEQDEGQDIFPHLERRSRWRSVTSLSRFNISSRGGSLDGDRFRSISWMVVGPPARQESPPFQPSGLPDSRGRWLCPRYIDSPNHRGTAVFGSDGPADLWTERISCILRNFRPRLRPRRPVEGRPARSRTARRTSIVSRYYGAWHECPPPSTFEPPWTPSNRIVPDDL